MEDDFKVTAQELPAAIESILFISGDPVTIDKLADILNCSKNAVNEAMKSLVDRYASNPWSGLEIRKTEEAYAIMTRPSQKKILDRMFGPRQTPPLSQASYETLAVIAYNQPCTRAQVELVRGVSSDSIISRLLDRGWIEEAGNLDAPGRPTLFKTSKQFLLEFGISSTDELPSMELMSYKTIRDLEDSLKNAAEGEDKQMTIEGFMAQGKGDGKPEEDNGDS